MKSVARRSRPYLSAAVGLLTLGTLGAQAPTITVTPANSTILVGQTQQFAQSGALTVTTVTSGGWHSCLLMSDQSVRCAGRNNQGQLGNGTLNNASSPVAINGLANVVNLKSGEEHMCAVMADGTMQCWGTNYTGQLGIGSAGEFGGVPFAWSPAPVQGISNAIAAVPGGFHTCAILSDHTVECWGRNQDGQVGNGDHTTDVTVPVPVTSLGPIASLTAGGYHTCAVMPDGTAQCWGRNDDGQLGNGGRTSSSTPVPINGLRPVAVSAGGYHTCALLPDGTVQCWGRNDWGQVGQPNSTGAFLTPTTVPGITTATAVVAGFYNTCAVLSDSTVRCWGQNTFGEVGDGTTSSASAPVQVAGLTGATALTVGSFHAGALLADTSVRCWGENDYGELGNGTVITSPTSVKMNDTGLAWATSDATIASIGVTGLATALARGTTTIAATDGLGNSGSATLTVKEMVTLSVTPQGDGSGSVTSTPGGISCGSTCSASYLNDSQVTLTAAAAAGSTFNGWSGCDTVSGPTCAVTMGTARSVAATFNKVLFTLTVNKADLGAGTVTSSPAGINCGTDCSTPYVSGASVTLTASALSGSKFTGWTGCDATSGATCTVTMNAARTATATFKLLFTLTVTKADVGSGTVTSSPAGINCGANCSNAYVSGTSVTLTASAASGSRFTGWAGCDTVSGATCTVTMTAARTATATFKPLFTLTVGKADLGAGTVTSTPPGIACGTACSGQYVSGTKVTLTAAAASGSVFIGWSGCDTAAGNTCTVTMNAARSVTATFKLLFTLSVSKTGIGRGTVTSSPAGISCGANCSNPYVSGTTVTLTATPDLGSVFLNGWSGCDAVSGLTGQFCTVTMGAAKSVTANFVLGLPLLP